MKKAFVLVPLALAMATVALPDEAHATSITYTAALSGPNEFPPNGSPGIGLAFVTIDDIANTMRVVVTFSGLTVPNTAAHIHCCTTLPGTGTAGVATTTPTFTGFPAGTAGSYDNVFSLIDAGSYNPAFVTMQGGLAGARAALLAGLASDLTYLNIHTGNFPAGEIRGFLTPVPEPTSLTLLGLGVAGVVARRRRK